MTEAEKKAIRWLGGVTMQPGSVDKQLIKRLQGLEPHLHLTPYENNRVAELLHKYRRQLGSVQLLILQVRETQAPKSLIAFCELQIRTGLTGNVYLICTDKAKVEAACMQVGKSVKSVYYSREYGTWAARIKDKPTKEKARQLVP